MNYTRGYYSLVQYCPDESRAESVNLGVVLFCPDRSFLKVMTSANNDRVRRLFGNRTFEPRRLNDAKIALQNRLQHEQAGGISTHEDFGRFAASRANDLLLTAPRPIKVAVPELELQALYNSLVLEPNSVSVQSELPTSKSQLRQQLRDLFSRPDIRKVQVPRPKVIVPLTGMTLKAPYGFQNGKLNLIVPIPFTDSMVQRASELALMGDLIRKHEADMTTPAALWITVPVPENNERAAERRNVEALFADYDVPVFREENFSDLVRKVEESLH